MLKGYEICPLCEQIIEEDTVPKDIVYKERFNTLVRHTKGYLKNMINMLEVSLNYICENEPEKAKSVLKSFLDSMNTELKNSNVNLDK